MMMQSRFGRWISSWHAILVLVLVVYIPVIWSGGFIWDDPQYVIGNPLLRTWAGLLAIWIHPSALPQYYPLVHTTFWMEYHLVGLHPLLYHIDNVLLHACGDSALAGAWCGLGFRGLIAAAIFAVHPVNVESVAWISERKKCSFAGVLPPVVSCVFGVFPNGSRAMITGSRLFFLWRRC